MIRKPAGEVPRYGTDLRRSVRSDLRQHGREQLGQAIADEKTKLEAESLAKLQALGDVRSLSRQEYAAAKREALKLLRVRP
jgi:hypothetical protein